MAEASSPVKLLKRLIWLYLILLLIEGALRKWALPSMDKYLLIIRDPLAIMIYMAAMSCRRFPFNGYVGACFLLAGASACASLLVTDTNMVVTLIGLRCYFLHFPLIFVMEKTLEEEDIWRMGKFFLWFAIPETILCVLQLEAPQTAWVNLAVGGQVTQGFSGAAGKFRPSGTFSFTTGVSSFYPLVLAALLGLMLARKKIPLYLSTAAAVCVAVAIPVSISRTNAVTCGLVLLASGVGVLFLPNAPKAIMRIVLFAGVVMLITSRLPQFDEGAEALASRWSDSTGPGVEGFRANIIDRFFSSLTSPVDRLFDTPLLGEGVGRGTLMAQAYLTGERSFALGEDEWPRVIIEMGPVLGLGFIFLRIGVCVRLIRLSFTALRRENILPLLFCIEAFFLVLNAQWAQATTAGFATFSAGLAFAAARMTRKPTPAIVRKRKKQVRRPGVWDPLAPVESKL